MTKAFAAVVKESDDGTEYLYTPRSDGNSRHRLKGILDPALLRKMYDL